MRDFRPQLDQENKAINSVSDLYPEEPKIAREHWYHYFEERGELNLQRWLG
jgi:hypothetical protein